MTHVFDINAPIERQRTRDGRKIFALHNSGLGSSPICTWIEWEDGDIRPCAFSVDGIGTSSNRGLDLITLPEPLPLIVSYQNFYPEKSGNYPCDSLESAAQVRSNNVIATVATTFDPNTGESSAKTVWKKGE